MVNINIEKLREDLMDYFGTAMSNGMPMAVIDLSNVQNASVETLISIAEENNFDLSNYEL